MQEQKNIIDCYNKTAANYAQQFMNELDSKHLDKILLKAFAVKNVSKGSLIDLGCGPGQTTKFLFDNGSTNLLGVDISSEMIKMARQIHPFLNFEQGDILNLEYDTGSFGSAISFYSIVHFDENQLEIGFKEMNRVLISKGELLLAFHSGDKAVHLDNFLGNAVDIDFYFFKVEKIKALLEKAGFDIIDILIRQPYEEIEYQSERAYIWSQKR